ncbi:hypothetical protein Hanom_Chr03g00270361 [Helianthus anomalus]
MCLDGGGLRDCHKRRRGAGMCDVRGYLGQLFIQLSFIDIFESESVRGLLNHSDVFTKQTKHPYL